MKVLQIAASVCGYFVENISSLIVLTSRDRDSDAIRVSLHYCRSNLLSPLAQFATQLFSPGRHFRCNVVLLSDIVLKIEELDCVVLVILQQFVVTFADGPVRALDAAITVMREVPVDRFVSE